MVRNVQILLLSLANTVADLTPCPQEGPSQRGRAPISTLSGANPVNTYAIRSRLRVSIQAPDYIPTIRGCGRRFGRPLLVRL